MHMHAPFPPHRGKRKKGKKEEIQHINTCFCFYFSPLCCYKQIVKLTANNKFKFSVGDAREAVREGGGFLYTHLKPTLLDLSIDNSIAILFNLAHCVVK